MPSLISYVQLEITFHVFYVCIYFLNPLVLLLHSLLASCDGQFSGREVKKNDCSLGLYCLMECERGSRMTTIY